MTRILAPTLATLVTAASCGAENQDPAAGETSSSSAASDAATTDDAAPTSDSNADSTAAGDDPTTTTTPTEPASTDDAAGSTTRDPSSTDATTTGEAQCVVPTTHPTIQAAVDDRDCSTVWVEAGTYLENVIIDRALTIAALDRGPVTIDASAAGSAIDITLPVEVTLSGLTITGGDATTGGGVRSSGDVILDSCTVTGNAASLTGAGIHSDATVTLTDSLVQANAIVATGQQAQGAGVFAQQGATLQATDVLDNTIDLDLAGALSGAAQGAGVATPGHLELGGDSMVAGNGITLVGSDGAGLGAGLSAGSADLAAGTTIADNTITASTNDPGLAYAYGGGIAIAFGDATLTGVVITGNAVESTGTAAMAGGGGVWLANATLTLVDATVTGNTVTSTATAVQAFGRGGGVMVDGDAIVETSLLDANTAYAAGMGPTVTEGGALQVSGGSITVTDTTLSNNTAQAEALGVAGTNAYGGAIAQRDTLGATMDVSRCVLFGNIATAPGHTRGGGIAVEVDMPATSTIAIVNSTLSGNHSDGVILPIGGGIAVQVDPGAEAALHLASSTVTLNEAGEGGGVWLQEAGAFAFARNTIVQANLASLSADCRATSLASSGYNLIGDDSGCAITGGPDLVGADAELQALADNGGPTQTHALTAGTAAVDAGDPAGCTDPLDVALDVDQRGEDRHVGPACDIGAFELP